MGYHRAGFEVVGVDIARQKNYPFEFHQADALTFPLDGFDAVHASPPCQAYSATRFLSTKLHPQLIEPVRTRLSQFDGPWVMENVPGAPLRHLIVLCGSMFGLGANGRQLRRHRWFESNVPMMSPPCCHDGNEPVGVYGNGGGGKMTRGYKGNVAESREAMGMPWAVTAELSQAIPPAYTEFIGGYLMAALGVTRE